MKIAFVYIFLVFVFFLGNTSEVFSQNWDNYQLLECQGDIPEEFITLSSSKLAQNAHRLDSTTHRKTRKAKEDFFVQSNFIVDQVLLSGKVIFNDPVTAYVNQVLDEILKGHPEVRTKIRVYPVKSSSVNAFTTNNGVIFINLGLIAQLEDEAQLAYILCHELQHFTQNHPIEKFLEAMKVDNSKGMYRKLSFDEMIMAKTRYSREQEMEADVEGLKLFNTTEYNIQSALDVFEVMLYSYLPVDDVKFDPGFLETNTISFPEGYLLETTNPISADPDYLDARSSHPNLKKRKTKLKAELGGNTVGGKKFIVGQNKFNEIRTLARFELCNILLLEKRFEEAIYTSFLLSRDHPNSIYLTKVKIKGLYGLTKYKNAKRFYDVHKDYDKVEGNSQQVFNIVEKLAPYELNTLALIHAWESYLSFPEDYELKNFAQDLTNELCKFHLGFAMDQEYIRPEAFEEKDENIERENISKYDKIRQSNDQNAIATIENRNYWLVDLLQNATFKSFFLEKVEEYSSEDFIQPVGSSFRAEKLLKEFRKKGKALGADRVVFVDAFFQKIHFRRDDSSIMIDEEKGKAKMNQMIRSNSQKLDLEAVMLDNTSFSAGNVDRFNDLAYLNNWVNDRLNHDVIENFIPINHQKIPELIKDYGTKYFSWSGAFTYTEKKKSNRKASNYLLFILPPVGFYYWIKPVSNTYYFSMVFNLEENHMDFGEFTQIKSPPRYDLMQSTIYNTLLQLKSKPPLSAL